MAHDDSSKKKEEEECRSSFTALARKEFNYKTETFPILIRDFSVRKDPSNTGCCSNSSGQRDDATSTLRMAPNFASAIFGPWLARRLGLGGPAPPPSVMRPDRDENDDYIVSDLSALLLPGQGTLVLGPSSSGKTTFMRTLSDLFAGKKRSDNVDGTVRIVGFIRSEKNRLRTTAYVDQSDVTLTPILTVEETVRFARQCAEGDTVDNLEESMDNVFRLTGLDHVKSTIVGNSEIRGVSGGQKRRVKLLEMAVGSSLEVLFLDEVTNGLDSASALSLCSILRLLAETTGLITVTCLLQPSVEALQTFHNLILLTQNGKLAYSGKTEEAVAYFESLGLKKPDKMAIPEFLLRCASSPDEFWDSEAGEIPSTVSSSSQLARSFKESSSGRQLIAEIDRFENESRVRPDDDGAAGAPLADFATPAHRQIGLLVGRGWKLVIRNPASVMRVVSAIIFGAFIGTLFLNTSSDEKGTLLRAGYVLTLLFLSFLNSCMAPLEEQFNDRVTFYIHRRANFYRTLSYYISRIFCSAPVALAEAFFLTVISFFAVGMNSHDGWGFFYFWALFSLATLNGNAVSRILAYCLPNNDVAQTLGPAILLLFILTAGYSPQYLQLPAWLRWISWISPCAYCYEGAIVNEVFKRQVGGIPGTEFAQEELGIPRVPYDTAPAGLSTEELVMAFDAYMLFVLTIVFETAGCFLLHHSQKWFGPTTKRYQVACGMSLTAPPWYTSSRKAERMGSFLENEANDDIPLSPPAHLTARDIIYEVDVATIEEEATAPEKAQGEPSENGNSQELFYDQSPGMPVTARQYGQVGNSARQEWMIKRRLGEDALGRSVNSSCGSSIRTELIPPGPGRLRLLSGITASFEPGTLTALMGSSGAGKSTLLDVLAGYKTGGHIAGEININGLPKTKDAWQAIAGYCEQVDLHNPSLTVRESLVFAARMRLRPFSMADDAKLRFADSVLVLMELDEFADMLVGDEAAGQGLPKHVRKRLTLGVELAAKPSILFADEPTSGLDSVSASVVVSSLERAAKRRGLTVVCTIHQPSREVFETFDNLLLLRKGGVCVYNGSIDSIDDYIESVPGGDEYAMPSEANPADHVLDVLCGTRGRQQDWGEHYSHSTMASDTLSRHLSCSCDSCMTGAIQVDTSRQSFASELYLEVQRQLLVNWRTPAYMAVRFWWTVCACLIIGVIYFQASDSGLTNVIGAIFFYVNVATVPLLSAMVPLITQRAVFYREVASGTVRRAVYGVAVQVAELPFNLVAALVSFVTFYFMVGLQSGAERIIYFLLMALAAYWLFPSMGLLFAALSPNLGAAVGIVSLLLTLFTLTMGFLIPASEIPPWYIWLYWINPLRFMLQGLTVNEVGGTPEGDDLLSAVSWSYGDRWWYCFVAVLLFGAASSAGIVAATRMNWLKR